MEIPVMAEKGKGRWSRKIGLKTIHLTAELNSWMMAFMLFTQPTVRLPHVKFLQLYVVFEVDLRREF